MYVHTFGFWNEEPDENTHGEAEAGEYYVGAVMLDENIYILSDWRNST